MRLKSIILSELGAEQLKATQRIEDAMNSSNDIEVNCNIIKTQLRELATLNQMIDIWRVITLPDTGIFVQSEQEEEKNKENG